MARLDRVLFTCGGTAGHVNPALALASRIRDLDPRSEALFVGADRGLERGLIEKAGWPFRAVHIAGIYRSLSPSALRHNAEAVADLFRSPHEARKILREFRPDVVIGTGGYASYPAVRAAARMGIPTAVHESNAVPGLTTRLLERWADRIMVGFEACRANYRHPEKVLVTGTPVRGELFARTKAEAKAALGMDDGRPLVVSFWGSLGASGMDTHMASMLAAEAEDEPFWHIHASGEKGHAVLLERLREKGVDLSAHPSLDVRPYIYDMPLVLRAADLAVCRAGASTIAELTALGTAAVLAPSPYVTGHHQEKNAQVLADAGGAVILREEECSGALLYQTVSRILGDGERLRSMEAAMASLGIRDASERILGAVSEICDRTVTGSLRRSD